MLFRPFLYPETACSSYLFGCGTHRQLAVCDPHVQLVDEYLDEAEQLGAPIVAVFETHVQADHVSGLPDLVERGATAYLPADTGVEVPHEVLDDGERVELGNTIVQALATPGHARTHNAYLVSDRRRGTEEPWLLFTGDSLLVGDLGRPDLHAGAVMGEKELAGLQHRTAARLRTLRDDLLVYPSHYGGSVCGRTLSGNPFSTIGFERRHNTLLAIEDEQEFIRALLSDLPPAPEQQEEIVRANRTGVIPAAFRV
jgi:hydroxyacylglutathione hydrolase